MVLIQIKYKTGSQNMDRGLDMEGWGTQWGGRRNEEDANGTHNASVYCFAFPEIM